MSSDPIVAEIRKAREAYAARFDSLEAMFEELRKQQAAGGRRVVSFSSQRLEDGEAAEILEEVGLARAMRRGKRGKSVSRGEIFKILRKRK